MTTSLSDLNLSPRIPPISLPPTSHSSFKHDETKFTRKPSSQNAPLPSTFTSSTPYHSRRRSYPVIRQSQFMNNTNSAKQQSENISVNGVSDMNHPSSSAIDSLRKHQYQQVNLSQSQQTPISTFLNSWFNQPSGGSGSNGRNRSHSHSQLIPNVSPNKSLGMIHRNSDDGYHFTTFTEQGNSRGRSQHRSQSSYKIRSKSPNRNKSRSKSGLKQKQQFDENNYTIDVDSTPKLNNRHVTTLNDQLSS